MERSPSMLSEDHYVHTLRTAHTLSSLIRQARRRSSGGDGATTSRSISIVSSPEPTLSQLSHPRHHRDDIDELQLLHHRPGLTVLADDHHYDDPQSPSRRSTSPSFYSPEIRVVPYSSERGNAPPPPIVHHHQHHHHHHHRQRLQSSPASSQRPEQQQGILADEAAAERILHLEELLAVSSSSASPPPLDHAAADNLATELIKANNKRQLSESMCREEDLHRQGLRHQEEVQRLEMRIWSTDSIHHHYRESDDERRRLLLSPSPSPPQPPQPTAQGEANRDDEVSPGHCDAAVTAASSAERIMHLEELLLARARSESEHQEQQRKSEERQRALSIELHETSVGALLRQESSARNAVSDEESIARLQHSVRSRQEELDFSKHAGKESDDVVARRLDANADEARRLQERLAEVESHGRVAEEESLARVRNAEEQLAAARGEEHAAAERIVHLEELLTANSAETQRSAEESAQRCRHLASTTNEQALESLVREESLQRATLNETQRSGCLELHLRRVDEQHASAAADASEERQRQEHQRRLFLDTQKQVQQLEEDLTRTAAAHREENEGSQRRIRDLSEQLVSREREQSELESSSAERIVYLEELLAESASRDRQQQNHTADLEGELCSVLRERDTMAQSHSQAVVEAQHQAAAVALMHEEELGRVSVIECEESQRRLEILQLFCTGMFYDVFLEDDKKKNGLLEQARGRAAAMLVENFLRRESSSRLELERDELDVRATMSNDAAANLLKCMQQQIEQQLSEQHDQYEQLTAEQQRQSLVEQQDMMEQRITELECSADAVACGLQHEESACRLAMLTDGGFYVPLSKMVSEISSASALASETLDCERAAHLAQLHMNQEWLLRSAEIEQEELTARFGLAMLRSEAQYQHEFESAAQEAEHRALMTLDHALRAALLEHEQEVMARCELEKEERLEYCGRIVCSASRSAGDAEWSRERSVAECRSSQALALSQQTYSLVEEEQSSRAAVEGQQFVAALVQHSDFAAVRSSLAERVKAKKESHVLRRMFVAETLLHREAAARSAIEQDYWCTAVVTAVDQQRRDVTSLHQEHQRAVARQVAELQEQAEQRLRLVESSTTSIVQQEEALSRSAIQSAELDSRVEFFASSFSIIIRCGAERSAAESGERVLLLEQQRQLALTSAGQNAALLALREAEQEESRQRSSIEREDAALRLEMVMAQLHHHHHHHHHATEAISASSPCGAGHLGTAP